MAIANLALAEEVLSLAPAERADLGKRLVQSLEGDPEPTRLSRLIALGGWKT